jgi:multiple sugar transport system substrate-binding protein
MRYTKIFASVAALAVSFGVLSAQTPTEITLFFHSGQGGERDALNTILENFNGSQSDFVATATEIGEGSYTDAVNAAALAGELPCLLDFDGPNLYNFAYSGYLIPLTPYASEELLADILPSIIEQGTYNGELYSLGTFDSGLGIWGRRSVLEAAGVRIPTGIEDAWTFEEFNAALEALQAVEGIQYALDLKMNYGEGEWFTYGFAPFMQGFGGDLINREDYQSSEGVLNGEAAVEAMTWFQSLFTNGYTLASPPDDNEFVNGNAALSYVGHWMYPAYKEAFGDDLVLIPSPMMTERAVTGSGSWNWGITSTCAAPDGAWALLDFMLSAEQMVVMTDAAGAVPSRISVLAEDERFAEGGDMHIYVLQLQNGVAIPRPATPAYPVITRAFAAAVGRIANGGDVQEALDEAVDTIDEDIAANDGYQN